MTSLQSAPTRSDRRLRTEGADGASAADRRRLPLLLLGPAAGAAAAAGTLAGCLAVGVVGWFLSDAGAHGTPRDGLRAAALGWSMAHGSGVHVGRAAVTVVPLGVTLLCAWVAWRVAHRVGDSVSGHGPDAARIADGERDWTVPAATTLYAAGYAGVAVLVTVLAGTPATAPSTERVLGWSLLLAAGVGGPAIAVGSGRAAIWAASLPVAVRATAAGVRRIVLGWLAVAVGLLLVGLALDVGTLANVFSRLHTDVGEGVLYALVTLAMAPNAAAFAGSYLLGPGFTLGTQTLVSPSLVVLGPLPMFPLVAALPEQGLRRGALVMTAVPAVLAAVAAWRAHRRFPTTSLVDGALRGCAAGILAGVVVAGIAALAGGAVGPGRMREVSPLAVDVLVHGIAAFGVGGGAGGLAAGWWRRHRAAGAA